MLVKVWGTLKCKSPLKPKRKRAPNWNEAHVFKKNNNNKYKNNYQREIQESNYHINRYKTFYIIQITFI